MRALSSSLRYDANRDNQRKLTANVGSDRNSQSIPEAELADAHASQRLTTESRFSRGLSGEPTSLPYSLPHAEEHDHRHEEPNLKLEERVIVIIAAKGVLGKKGCIAL